MRQAIKSDNMRLATNVPGLATVAAFVPRYHIDGAKAPAADVVSAMAAKGLTTATQIVTTNITSPATPRNLQVVGNAAGIVGNVTVKGTAYDGSVINEVFALNGVTTVVGAKAFKTITEIDLPIKTNASGDTVSVGAGNKLGVPYKLTFSVVLAAFLNKVKEGTAATLTTSATNIESNTVTLSSALNGNDVDVFLVV